MRAFAWWSVHRLLTGKSEALEGLTKAREGMGTAELREAQALARELADRYVTRAPELGAEEAEAETHRVLERRHEVEEARRTEAEAAARKAEGQRRKEVEKMRRRSEVELARRKAEEERRAERAEAERRREEEERDRRERMAREQQRLEQERKAIFARALEEYIGAIQASVAEHWRRPTGVPTGLACTVNVLQDDSGRVLRVEIIESSGNIAFDRSVEQALRAASPLPRPWRRAVFDREVLFLFRPRG